MYSVKCCITGWHYINIGIKVDLAILQRKCCSYDFLCCLLRDTGFCRLSLVTTVEMDTIKKLLSSTGKPTTIMPHFFASFLLYSVHLGGKNCCLQNHASYVKSWKSFQSANGHWQILAGNVKSWKSLQSATEHRFSQSLLVFPL